MKSNFERAMEQTLGFEMGEANHPKDRGGHTYRGITQALYDRWRKRKGFPLRTVTEVTDDEIVAIAREEFWDPCRCGELPAHLAIAVFDMAFHSSPRDASIALQQALGVIVDGQVGMKTIAASRAAGPDIVLAFLKARAREMRDIWLRDPEQLRSFGAGWMNRLLDQAWRGGAK